MDKYHIYEEIGKGEFSQVFKGREKKKIEYVAIKRVEKSKMDAVVNEVQVMHKMDRPHTLQFHDWYETRNNLWLILEYCTGSDLETLLRQDGHLPEQSVRTFGLDMLAGIKYMHSMGMMHCDIRPRNFLVDEYGILKISDFKSCRKVPKKALGDVPLEERGTAEYMAPELFLPEGLHSYASDFWSLGCVLYELRRGGPPFGDEYTSRDSLLKNIREKEPVRDPLPVTRRADDSHRPTTGGSRPDSRSSRRGDRRTGRRNESSIDDSQARRPGAVAPREAARCRCNWEQISTHPFWGKENITEAPESLPNENAYYNLVSKIEDRTQREQERHLIEEFGLTAAQAEEIMVRSQKGELVRKEEIKEDGTRATATIFKGALSATPGGKPERPHVSDHTPVRPPEKGSGGDGRKEITRIESIQEQEYETIPPAVSSSYGDERANEGKMETPQAKDRGSGQREREEHPQR